MKTVIIFDNFGPYHLARLSACARCCELTAIEVAASSADYAWTREAGTADRNRPGTRALDGSHFRHVTLFERGTSREVHRRELARRMNQALDDCAPDVVCIPGWSDRPALVALHWCAERNVPVVAMSESTEWDDHRIWWKEFTKRKLVSLCGAAFVGGTPHKDYIVKLGMPKELVFFGYDSVDNRYFENKAEDCRRQKSEYRTRYKLPENYFLASARFIEKKNLALLLEAYAAYRKQVEASSRPPFPSRQGATELVAAGLLGDSGSEEGRPGPAPLSTSDPWDLVLLGDGPLRPELSRRVSDLRLDASVHLPGFKQYPDLPAFYALANVFVHASSTEQWGLVVNEAMACGLPVMISNRCGCASELVREGENGFTFNPTNRQELADLMVRMSGLGVNLNAMGKRSREIVAEWSVDRFAESMKAACEAAIGGSRKERGRLARATLAISLQTPDKVFAGGNVRGDRLGVRGIKDLPPVTIKPSFFIIGAPKSGTTSLCEYLKDHPNIYFSAVKEPHFFDSDTSKRLKLNRGTYLSLFSNAKPDLHKAVGEASTGYLFSKVAVPEILDFNPNAKFIVMLRNPVDLVQAWHAEMYFEGVEDVREFEKAWRLEPSRRLGKCIPRTCWETRKLFYSDWGRLGDQVEHLFSVASRGRVKAIVFEDFVTDTKRVYEEVLTFLGLPPCERIAFSPVNENRNVRHAGLQRSLAWAANYFRLIRIMSGLELSLGLGLFRKTLLLNSKPLLRKPASPALRAELTEFYREDIQKLSKLLDRDLSGWVA
jgi:1,2-diacylglycerol 3-alpha-glucosyltransferase